MIITKERMEISGIIRKIEDEGCSCDLMYGWGCGIHELIGQLSKAISDALRESGK